MSSGWLPDDDRWSTTTIIANSLIWSMVSLCGVSFPLVLILESIGINPNVQPIMGILIVVSFLCGFEPGLIYNTYRYFQLKKIGQTR